MQLIVQLPVDFWRDLSWFTGLGPFTTVRLQCAWINFIYVSVVLKQRVFYTHHIDLSSLVDARFWCDIDLQ